MHLRTNKKDFIEHYDVSPKNKCGLLGGNHLNFKTHCKNLQPIINKPYILYIGSRNKYKILKYS